MPRRALVIATAHRHCVHDCSRQVLRRRDEHGRWASICHAPSQLDRLALGPTWRTIDGFCATYFGVRKQALAASPAVVPRYLPPENATIAHHADAGAFASASATWYGSKELQQR
jgi:hypothetical protein